MSKKDEAREELRTAISRWGYGAGSYDYILGALDAYGAACAEEARREACGVVPDTGYDRRESGQSETGYALRMAADDLEQRPDDREAIIDGLVPLLLPTAISAAEQRGYERGIAVVTAALEAFWDGDPCEECGRGDPARWPVGEQLIADLRSRPQPKREETE